MLSQTNEKALESTIEKRLTGSSLEVLKEQNIALKERAELYRAGNGYYIGIPEDFKAKYAIDETRFWDFLQSTQKEELAKLQKQSDWRLKILERLDPMIKKYGILRSFSKGLDVPYEVTAWEKLFWFLKFLIPKLIIVDKDKDAIDGLLKSVDLSTYGLERVKLNTSIALDTSETELNPQNRNPRGAHGEKEKNELDVIIKSFNERWFQGREATPDEQRAKFINLAQKMKEHTDFKEKHTENSDIPNREIAFSKIFDDVMGRHRKNEVDLYRLVSQDEGFKIAI